VTVAERESPPSPRRVVVAVWTRAGRVSTGVTIALLLALASFPFWASSETMRTIVEFVALLAMAQMWNLLAGYAGLVSIGQQAYIGIGAYSLFVFANDFGINPFLSVLLAAVVAALLAIPTSRVIFGLTGGYFAVATWVVAEVYRLLVSNVNSLGSGAGQSLTAMLAFERSTREAVTFWLAVVLLAASTLGVYLLLRSRLGLALTAIRDDAIAAESQGIDVRRTKLIVYVLAAFGSGFAGALYFLEALRVTPDAAFGMSWIPLLFFTVVIGGIGTIEGPILGTLIYFFLRNTFSDYGTWYLIALGLFAIVVMIFFPRGIFGELAHRFGWRLFPSQRVLREPSAAEIPPMA
jgi:branched-chain amino acid transport system permease protein